MNVISFSERLIICTELSLPILTTKIYYDEWSSNPDLCMRADRSTIKPPLRCMRYSLWMQLATIIGDERLRLSQPVVSFMWLAFFSFCYGIKFELRALNVWDWVLICVLNIQQIFDLLHIWEMHGLLIFSLHKSRHIFDNITYTPNTIVFNHKHQSLMGRLKYWKTFR